MMRSFLERLMFPYAAYTNPYKSVFPKKINTGSIYTMNITEEQIKEYGYKDSLSRTEMTLQMIFGASESLYSYDTYQFDDYSKVVADRFDSEKKAKRRKEEFPIDCEKALKWGRDLPKINFLIMR